MNPLSRFLALIVEPTVEEFNSKSRHGMPVRST
jgi:hypothetical protein